MDKKLLAWLPMAILTIFAAGTMKRDIAEPQILRGTAAQEAILAETIHETNAPTAPFLAKESEAISEAATEPEIRSETIGVSETRALPEIATTPESTIVPESTVSSVITVELETTATSETTSLPDRTAASKSTVVSESTAAPESIIVSETTNASETIVALETTDASLVSSISQTQTVYWVEGGEVWHLTPSCSSLSRSKNILSGTEAAAQQAGKERLCKRCGK